MSGRLGRKVGALLGALGLCLTTGAVVMQESNVVQVAAAPISPTDASKVPHYFGPYPNWANSPQTLANAVVTITPQSGDPGTGATATATVLPRNGAVVGSIGAITVTSPGSGYLAPPAVTIEAPGVTPTTVATAHGEPLAGCHHEHRGRRGRLRLRHP